MFRLLNLKKSVRVELSVMFICTKFHVALHLLSLHSLFFFLFLVQIYDGNALVLLCYQLKVVLFNISFRKTNTERNILEGELDYKAP